MEETAPKKSFYPSQILFDDMAQGLRRGMVNNDGHRNEATRGLTREEARY